MKLFLIVISLFSLQLASFVSAQSLADEISDLTDLNTNLKNSAERKLSAQYDAAKAEMSDVLQKSVAQSVNEVFQYIEVYIKDVETQTSNVGYDASSCVKSVRDILSSDILPNITEKASQELVNVYQTIAFNTRLMGTYHMAVISKEIDSITAEYTACINSEEPAYCNRTLSYKVISKEGELPGLYDKEVERINIALIQQVVDYKSRVQDYVQEAIAVIRPYLALLESCVSIVIAVGN